MPPNRRRYVALIGVRLPVVLLDKIDEAEARTGLSRSEVIRAALVEHLMR